MMQPRELDFEGLEPVESPVLPEMINVPNPRNMEDLQVPYPVKPPVIPEMINVPNPKNVEDLQIPVPVKPQGVVVNRTIPVYKVPDPVRIIGRPPPDV